MNEQMPTRSEGRQKIITPASKASRSSTLLLPHRAKRSVSSDGTNGSIIAVNNAVTTPSVLTLPNIKTLLRLLIIFILTSLVSCEDKHLDCEGYVSITSPRYPSSYHSGDRKEWHITAPYHKRILVEFNDFSLLEDDFLFLLDTVGTEVNKKYTGRGARFPQFLSKGNELKMTFSSSPTGTSKGFNISLSCYVKADKSLARMVDGRSPGEGFLELRTQSNGWMRVCGENFSKQVAEVVCGELGYPGVKEISFQRQESPSDEHGFIVAPFCADYTHLLEDCSQTIGNCTSDNAVKVYCWEPGYKGCYNSAELPRQNGSTFTSLSECVSSCRTEKQEALAIVSSTSCLCSTAEEVGLSDLVPADNCNQKGDAVNSLVYNASVGFCRSLNVTNGYWNSSITWIGSIVHLTCDNGYTVNGNKTLQCVPGVSPYIPKWNYFPPICEMIEDTTKKSTTYAYETTGAPHNHQPWLNNAVVAAPSSIAIIFVGILCFMISQYSLIATTFTMPGRRKMGLIRHCKTHFTTGNGGTEHSPGYTALPHPHGGVSQSDTLRMESQLHLPSSQDSSPVTSFPSLQGANMHLENHYHSSENDSDPYHYATSLGISPFSSVSGNHPPPGQSEMDITENAYELSENATDQITSSDHRPEMVPMFNRPLPHRPVSLDIHDGPSPPPRERPGTHSLTHSTGLSSGHDWSRACASDYNSLNDDVIFMSRRILNDYPLPHDREQTPRKGARAQHDGFNCSSTEASARTSEYHGYYSADELEDKKTFNDTVSLILPFSKPDPFYHVLERGHSQMRSNDPSISLKTESEHQNNYNHESYLTDVMIDNVLYNPLKSYSK